MKMDWMLNMIIDTEDMHTLIKINREFNGNESSIIALESSLQLVEEVAKKTGLFVSTSIIYEKGVLTNEELESAKKFSSK